MSNATVGVVDFWGWCVMSDGMLRVVPSNVCVPHKREELNCHTGYMTSMKVGCSRARHTLFMYAFLIVQKDKCTGESVVLTDTRYLFSRGA